MLDRWAIEDEVTREVLEAARESGEQLTGTELGSRVALACVEREPQALRDVGARDAPSDPGGAAPGASAGAASTRRRATPKPGAASRHFTVRLLPEQYDALERRADRSGIPVSAMARNLIATGLTRSAGGGEVTEALDRLETDIAAVRRLLA